MFSKAKTTNMSNLTTLSTYFMSCNLHYMLILQPLNDTLKRHYNNSYKNDSKSLTTCKLRAVVEGEEVNLNTAHLSKDLKKAPFRLTFSCARFSLKRLVLSWVVWYKSSYTWYGIPGVANRKSVS